MKDKHYKTLLKKYLNNELNDEELVEFLTLTEANEQAFLEETSKISPNRLQEDFRKKVIFQNIIRHPDFSSKQQKLRKLKFPALLRIAALLIAFGAISLIAYHYIQQSAVDRENTFSTNIITDNNVFLSGKESVIMKLADGTTMTLDDAALQETIEKDGLIIQKMTSGEVIINIVDRTNGSTAKGKNHIFSTPKGEGFAFTLPDGTKVWLNSFTKISIPADFNDAAREIYLEGEAFFDVAHNAAKPFQIHTGKDQIKVLGTAFNVRAYHEDEQIYTTLLRGSVRVSANDHHIVLRPGEQAVSDQLKGSLAKRHVDVDQFIGWKDGYFKFVDEPVQGILNELTRWYDIKSIDYHTKNTDRFTASIKRTKSLAEVLRNIERVSDLQFTIEEGRVLVKDK